MAATAQYGSNPNWGANLNGDNGWGGYQWPGGVPQSLLATITVRDLKWVLRDALAPLVTGLVRYTEEKLGYDIEGWQSWSYSNRNIAGTNSASNHSRGRAFDINATENPYSSQFICNIPPAVVKVWEQHGFFWGGRYNGRTDTMHFEYIGTPANVPFHIASINGLLGADTTKPTKAVPYPATRASGKTYGRKGAPKSEYPNGTKIVMTGFETGSVGDKRRIKIKLIQKALGIEADGYFGQGTANAVKDFQRRTKCAKVTGFVGPVTWKALKIKA